MTRPIKLLTKLVQLLDKTCSHLQSVRVKSYTILERYSGVEIVLERNQKSLWPKLGNPLRSVPFYADDKIELLSTQRVLDISDHVYGIDDLIASEHSIKIMLSHEEPCTQHALLSALHKHTAYGLPKNFYAGLSLGKTSWFWGVNTVPLDMSLHYPSSSLKSKDGLEYILIASNHPRVDFTYLDEERELKIKSIPIENYFTTETSNRVNSYHFKCKQGLHIYSLFPESMLTGDSPLSDWKELSIQVNDMANQALERHLGDQVLKLEKRIKDTTSRKKLSFRGEVLGVEPVNEQETVILFERYISKNNGLLGSDARLRILDYSPQGIDSICEFSPSQSTPTTVVPVEFEYVLKNFFDHGHDPRQVHLILCYSTSPLTFPYDHFGTKYTIDRSGSLPKLVNMNTGASTFLFALDDVLQ